MSLRAQFLPVLFLTIAFTTPINAQSHRGGGGGNGHKPSVEVTTNLSYPAYFLGTSQQSGTIGSYSLNTTATGMSYGCLLPEKIGTTTFPNTSCVDSTGSPQDLATCQSRCKDPETGANLKVERIYWQKDPLNKWQAGYASSEDSLQVRYIDWGDNLETKTWPVQVLRVETNTFSALPSFDATAQVSANPAVRFDMWHVFGQGTDELWGVHTTNADSPVPYVYFTPNPDNAENSPILYWPYAVDYSSAARLNIAKLEKTASTCPSTATNATQLPDELSGQTWNPATQRWSGQVYTNDMAYTPELNIKGSYVYGYNWNLRAEAVPVDVNKGGWWRLTFYTTDQSIKFTNWEDPGTAGYNSLAPPDPLDLDATLGLLPANSSLSPSGSVSVASQDRIRLRQRVTAGVIVPAEETSGMLYVPQVDKVYDLTYLDICIAPSEKGGSGKGKKK